MNFSEEILKWYQVNKRSLPWRGSTDPYKIWLSEVILQQTRVVQGIPYYLKFVETYPEVGDLARASEAEVLKLWQGLGYYSRARNLHAAAKMVSEQYGGVFPETYGGLLGLKGVGDYTASAIASICFNVPEPVVDGNVYRVLARYFGVDLAINSTEGVKYFKKLAREVMDVGRIRDYNQGIMEFGAIQCVPKSPDCEACPLSESCVALQMKRVGDLPLKLKKTKVRSRYFNYIVFVSKDGRTVLEQRKGKGIWENLWQFPLIESTQKLSQSGFERRFGELNQTVDLVSIDLFNPEAIVHKLSHQHLYTSFWVVRTKEFPMDGISFEEADTYPVPVLIADFLRSFKKSYF
ncbi:A/G-specific DNA-adenine glycosylase [Zobellia uliginosa]|uniref:Adenine DNA glycosylase n=1 Tax=Zobellia uliginosa TaxID=143224 RepID=A0ABY1KJ50_9FLAO|nr:A/G-specific adenine glycosylase [Zobellia uliginosa]SIS40540.1 A/G-specific DNA-adenine glycosylase [Zobellia uliginosa]